MNVTGAEKSLTYQIDLDVSGFNIDRDNEGRLSISSDCHILGYGDDTTLPGLPSKAIAVALPADTRFVSCSFTPISRTLIDSGVYVLPNPRIQPIGSVEIYDTIPLPDYSGKRYPDVSLAHTYDVYTEKTTIVYFSYCPFEYDGDTRNLRFINSGELTVSYIEGLEDGCIKTRIYTDEEQYYAESVIGYPSDSTGIASYSAYNDIVDIGPISDTEYLIITNEQLKDYFQQLADWKTVKGVPTEVVTVEEIFENTSPEDGPLLIKKYLVRRYKDSNRLRYVLLGGDDTVVPVRYCYGEAWKESTDALVTDLYYACLSGEYDWDSNGNGVYGEPVDNVNLSTQLNISRLPVRTASHVKGYIKKLLDYEGPKSPDKVSTIVEKNNFLMCGSRLHPLAGSNVMIQALKSAIDSIWNGDVVSLSNENIKFENGDAYELTNDILGNHLMSGYRFMNMFSHGIQTGWELGNGDLFSADLALNYRSNSNSLISTIACHTNAFDNRQYYNFDGESYVSDPCLSEAFIRNPNNGVIAYLGASNEGLGDDKGFGPSFNYEKTFYQTLFSNCESYNNFSKVVSITKKKNLGTVYGLSMSEMNNRWVHFCLNPVGDAEVPIYTDVPKDQNEPVISLSGSTLEVSTESGECRITLTDANSYGKLYYGMSEKGSASFIGFDKTKNAYLCICRPGYRPLLYYIHRLYEGTSCGFTKCNSFPYTESSIRPTGKIISYEYDGEKLTVTTSVSDDFQNVEVRSLTSGGTLTDKSAVNIGDEAGTAILSVRNGVNIVSLIADGEILDSVTVIR